MSRYINQKQYWEHFAKTSNLDVLRKDLNGSWDAAQQKYLDFTEIPENFLSFLKESIEFNRVLDFGVGMGRNTSYLGSLFKESHGFDTCPMVNNLKKTEPQINLLTCDWEIIKNNSYDLVFESTVFQHMNPDELKLRLSDLSKISKYLFSWTRSYNDYNRDFSTLEGGINILQLLEESFEVVRSDAPMHLIGSKMDESHFKMILKSKEI